MGCHGVLRRHVPTRQSRLRPTAKESKITEPPQNPNGDPANCNRRTPCAPTGGPQAGHSPEVQHLRDAGIGQACGNVWESRRNPTWAVR